MKLQTDHFYKTRDGHKAYVSYVKAGGFASGILLGDDFVITWKLNGNSVSTSALDLVSEWEPEPLRLEVGKRYKTRDGHIAFVTNTQIDGRQTKYFVGVISNHGNEFFLWDEDGSWCEDKTNETHNLVECLDDD